MFIAFGFLISRSVGAECTWRSAGAHRLFRGYKAINMVVLRSTARKVIADP